MTDSPERLAWLEARKNLITASDCAAMLCCNYAKNEADKVHQRSQLLMQKAGLAEGFAGSERTDLSGMLEGAVVGLARDLWGWPIERCPANTITVDSECAALGASLDAVVRNPYALTFGIPELSPVDVKISAAAAQEDCKPKKGGEPSGAMFAQGIPLMYQLQLSAQMACTGARHSALLVLHHNDQAGLKLRAYYMPRHEGIISRIRSEAVRFVRDLKLLKEGKHG